MNGQPNTLIEPTAYHSAALRSRASRGSCGTLIVFSWVLISLAVICWLALKPDYFIWKILALLAFLPRINTIEKERIESISRNPSVLTKVGYIYAWLAGLYFICIFSEPK